MRVVCFLKVSGASMLVSKLWLWWVYYVLYFCTSSSSSAAATASFISFWKFLQPSRKRAELYVLFVFVPLIPWLFFFYSPEVSSYYVLATFSTAVLLATPYPLTILPRSAMNEKVFSFSFTVSIAFFYITAEVKIGTWSEFVMSNGFLFSTWDFYWI